MKLGHAGGGDLCSGQSGPSFPLEIFNSFMDLITLISYEKVYFHNLRKIRIPIDLKGHKGMSRNVDKRFRYLFPNI